MRNKLREQSAKHGSKLPAEGPKAPADYDGVHGHPGKHDHGIEAAHDAGKGAEKEGPKAPKPFTVKGGT